MVVVGLLSVVLVGFVIPVSVVLVVDCIRLSLSRLKIPLFFVRPRLEIVATAHDDALCERERRNPSKYLVSIQIKNQAAIEGLCNHGIQMHTLQIISKASNKMLLVHKSFRLRFFCGGIT